MLISLLFFLFIFCLLTNKVHKYKSYSKKPNLKNKTKDIAKYSPDTCTPTNYKFTFIFDNKANEFKVHGIWPDQCEECLTCTYPSCCNLSDITYTEPNDPTNFIPTKWYNTTAHEDCTDNSLVPLFKHEFYKHASCSTDMKTTDDFLNKAIELYDKYYDDYVNNHCEGFGQIWLNLDADYNYISTTCVQ